MINDLEERLASRDALREPNMIMQCVRPLVEQYPDALEFITVFIVAANKNYIPLKSAINRTDPAEREAAIVSERCLLYVAMTRAKKKVVISSYGAISEFLR